MTQLTIEIPDDLVSRLKGLAAEQNKSVEQVAAERLRSLVGTASPKAILRAIARPPHVSSAAVDDLEAAIAGGRLPVREQGAFEG